MPTVDVGALYRGARTGGDFFDFAAAGPSRMLVMLLDIAGRRDEALDIAAQIQDVFRARAGEIFAAADLNEADAVTRMALELNRAVISAAGGVRCAPGFVGCYNEVLGTLCYVNAGHTPALLRDGSGISALDPNGLPLGLFSHATHDAMMCALPPHSTLLLVSRGLVEAKGGGEEFGLERVKKSLSGASTTAAQEVCVRVLDDVKTFLETARKRGLLRRGTRGPIAETDPLGDNDATTLALVRG